MSKSKARIQSSAATLASVKKEMAKPRVAESARQDPDTLANGGRIAVVSRDEAASKIEARRALLSYGKKVGV